MSEFMEWLGEHSFIEVAVIAAVILLTQLLKWPIKVAAVRYEQKTGISKSRITWVISFLPLIMCFCYSLVACGIQAGWDTDTMSWVNIIKQTVVLSSASVGFYEVIKKVIEAAISKEVAVKSGVISNDKEFVTLEEVNGSKK